MKYKVGDKVRVRKDLKVYQTYGRFSTNRDMVKKAGKVVTIRYFNDICESYKVKEDKYDNSWTDEMLEGLAEMDKIEIIVDGNKTIAKKGDKTSIAKCSPEDEFDIFVGAKLALKRLEEKCKPYRWLKCGVGYYRPDINLDTMYTYATYYNDDTDKRLMSRGLAFKTKEEAVVAAKKMLAVLKEDEDDDES